MHNPPHPGEVIREYLGEMSVTDAARHLGVGRVTLSRVLNGKAVISTACLDPRKLQRRSSP
jgi:addiction module HigA family antidote